MVLYNMGHAECVLQLPALRWPAAHGEDNCMSALCQLPAICGCSSVALRIGRPTAVCCPAVLFGAAATDAETGAVGRLQQLAAALEGVGSTKDLGGQARRPKVSWLGGAWPAVP